jgi:hypothetical protein
MKTLIASLLILTTTVFSQVEPIDWVAAWNQLTQQEGENLDLNSQQAQDIIQGILAQNIITAKEADILVKYYMAKDGKEAWQQVAVSIQQKSPFAAAAVKASTRDGTNWTQEMVEQNPGAAAWTALPSEAPDNLKLMTWNVINNKIATGAAQRRFFKEYRKNLPIQEQITATENQKARLIAKVNRTEEDNSWLVEVAADLIALRIN